MKIFIPSDLTDHSLELISKWIENFDKPNSEIYLIHIIEPSKGGGAIMIDITQVLYEEAARKMDAFVEGLDLDHAKIQTEIQTGYYADRIKEMIMVCGADLLVMNSKKKFGLEGFFDSQRSKKFVGNMPCPVLIIPEAKANFDFEKIGIAVDGADQPNDHTQSTISRIAAYFGAESIPFHVNAANHDNTTTYANQQVAVLASKTVMEGIKDFVTTEDIDLLVLTTHEKSFIQSWLDDNISKGVVAENFLPTLVINQT